MWPIQLNFLLLIVVLISFCLVFFQSSLFDILLGHHILSEATIDEDLEFVLLLRDLVVFHVSQPYRRTGLTLVLKMRILVFMDSWEESHTGHRVLKAWRALLMRSSTSLSAPPFVLMLLPR